MNKPDNFRYTFYTTRKGETVYINEDGEWKPATVRRPRLKFVEVVLDGHRLALPYEALRREI